MGESISKDPQLVKNAGRKILTEKKTMNKEDIIKLRYEYEKRLTTEHGAGLRIYIHGVYSGPPYTPNSKTKIDG